MKKIVFMHVDAIPKEKHFNEITDDELIKLMMEDEDGTDFWLFDSFEELIAEFNVENAPSQTCWFGRIIEI